MKYLVPTFCFLSWVLVAYVSWNLTDAKFTLGGWIAFNLWQAVNFGFMGWASYKTIEDTDRRVNGSGN